MFLSIQRAWWSAVPFLLFAATAAAEPRKSTHVACVGDSITQGSGASSGAKNYVAQLKVLMGDQVDVRNFGVSGRTMLSEGYGDHPYQLEQKYVDATSFVANAPQGSRVSVVIVLGANDSKPWNWEPDGKPKNDQQYLKDYRAMVDHFLGLPSKPVVYVGLPLATGNNPCCSIRGDVIRDQQIPLIKQVAMEKRVPIIDLNTPTTNHPEYFGDGVHPNDDGYLVMANLVKAGLEREPRVTITNPVAGAMPPAGMLSLSAMVSAETVDIASVEFFDGASSLGKTVAAPFTLNWQATVGPHSITATATDTTLASKTSGAVMFTVKDAPLGGSGGAAGGGGGGSGGASSGAGGAAAGTSSGGTAASTAGSAGNAAGTGTSSGGTAASTAGSAGNAAGTGTSSSGTASGFAVPGGEDGGCSCSVVAGSRHGLAAWIALILGMLAARRRRPS